MRPFCFTLLLALACLSPACKKSDEKNQAAVTITTTRPAGEGDAEPIRPTTRPASLPASSTLLIGLDEVQFPPARLVLQQSEPTLSLLLFSDDPPDSVRPNYSGNRYYFEINLRIDDVAQLNTADWTYKAASIQRSESPNGVFLFGDRVQLQPDEVEIVFTGSGSNLNLALRGRFLRFQGREVAAPQPVPVQGTLNVQLETQGDARP